MSEPPVQSEPMEELPPCRLPDQERPRSLGTKTVMARASTPYTPERRRQGD
ncbi:hypothetical protein [Mumia zhuanghuii]|uniref:hypothetical protein n=1 Tax=Mumia zhuanghuii TaxID=2585211 RepID=UPI00129C60A6|nr:hypothetical protein [Mumia zhuanghuii]